MFGENDPLKQSALSLSFARIRSQFRIGGTGSAIYRATNTGCVHKGQIKRFRRHSTLST